MQPLNPVVAVVDDVAAGTQAAAVGLLLQLELEHASPGFAQLERKEFETWREQLGFFKF